MSSSRCSRSERDCVLHRSVGRQVPKAAGRRPAALFLRAKLIGFCGCTSLKKKRFRLLLSLFIRPHVSAPVPAAAPDHLRARVFQKGSPLCDFKERKKKKKQPSLCFHFMWPSRRQSASVLFAAAGSREQRLWGGETRLCFSFALTGRDTLGGGGGAGGPVKELRVESRVDAARRS